MSRIPPQQGVLTRKEKQDGDSNLENYSQVMADDEENQLSLSKDSQRSPLLEEKERDNQDNPEQSSHRPRKTITYQLRNGAIFAFLSLSCITNIILLTRKLPHERSKYADLATDVPVAFEWATEYSNPNLTEAAALWESISFDVGMVALPYIWTEEKSLPRAQPFPWDHSQGLYVLNGYHALHCLKGIHRSLREYALGAPQTLPLMHITHCLDSLRRDVLCAADDTPRYTTVTKSPESAVGQVRMCRDWGKLEQWAKERTSCYRYINHAADFRDQFERFRVCPTGSRYEDAAREHFAKAERVRQD